jgi:hypothetical protein
MPPGCYQRVSLYHPNQDDPTLHCTDRPASYRRAVMGHQPRSSGWFRHAGPQVLGRQRHWDDNRGANHLCWAVSEAVCE